ncbi:replication endonuclease [Shewanella psychromarinicola]|uniref:Replication endonuclease n=1 Tax=Shewanella psychromarinicola TaxID=2487742 RepID=A0A3N4EKW1_9GAMM|nr:replication endonuclease [Shewanella psychromarinicola]AZG37016.1 replication endonuclease [Shewanella psychromarinicola]MCL1081144.1 replication endonuclease [Shewanella psychromarinicola]RPA34870.1 replication endonuclease [Shewanella psychromarinicola]
MTRVELDNAHFIVRRLYGLPQIHKNALMHRYERFSNHIEANLYLLRTTTAISKVLGHSSNRMSCVSVDDRDFKAMSKHHARQCAKIASRVNSQSLFKTYSAILRYVTCYQIKPHPLTDTALNNLEHDCLTNEEYSKVMGVIKRACDESWWKPKLRRLHNRQIETISRLLNQVSRHRGIYASNITVENYKSQWQSNRELLENTLATNELDFSVSLAELSDLNVSNPKIRKAELMVRIRGFEDYSTKMGYAAVFLTMTTPSKYHRCFAKSGAENPKWQGETPLDGQDYLNRTFQRIRASLNRDKITPFGFRVAEPHHDGTPHWHLLLFVQTEQQEALVKTFQEYCLQEDGDEQGAKERRFKVEYIDPKKGSATGYIAKYVAKGIDGEGIEHDLYGTESVTAATRIRVWASCWGIRQFQQIGGVGVTPWRELRRLSKITDESLEWVEDIRQAADDSDWGRYTELMGGVFCKREDQLIRPLYEHKKQKRSHQISDDNCRNAYEKTKDADVQSVLNPLDVTVTNAGNATFHQGLNTNVISGNPEKSQDANAEINAGTDIDRSEVLSKHSRNSAQDYIEPSIYKANRYGDELIVQLKGIVALGVEIITRVHEWTITLAKHQTQLTWSSVNNCTTLVTKSESIPNSITINLRPEDKDNPPRMNEIDLSKHYMRQTAIRC